MGYQMWLGLPSFPKHMYMYEAIEKSLISVCLCICSKRYPAANGPPVDRRCEQCGSIFKVYMTMNVTVHNL